MSKGEKNNETTEYKRRRGLVTSFRTSRNLMISQERLGLTGLFWRADTYQ